MATVVQLRDPTEVFSSRQRHQVPAICRCFFSPCLFAPSSIAAWFKKAEARSFAVYIVVLFLSSLFPFFFPIDICFYSPCQNHCQCIPLSNRTFSCACSQGFVGTLCELRSKWTKLIWKPGNWSHPGIWKETLTGWSTPHGGPFISPSVCLPWRRHGLCALFAKFPQGHVFRCFSS